MPTFACVHACARALCWFQRMPSALDTSRLERARPVFYNGSARAHARFACERPFGSGGRTSARAAGG